MAKNLIPEIARMLGVELGEEFKIKELVGLTYKFDDKGLSLIYDNHISVTDASATTVVGLLNGEYEIEKLLWRPKPGEYYYTYNSLWEIISVSWRDDLYDLCWQKLDLVFRTEEEALKERPHIYEEWTGEEWEE